MERSPVWALAFWGGVIGALGYLDWELHHSETPEWTLSCTGRDYGHLDHPLGEAAFWVGLAAFNYWFGPHMVRPARVRRAAKKALRTVPTSAAATKS